MDVGEKAGNHHPESISGQGPGSVFTAGAVAEVLAQANIGGGFNGRIEVPVIVDGREIARAVREAEGSMGKQTVFGGFANVY